MELKDNRPVFIQIKEWVEDNILSGRWSIGHQLPSVREMSAKFRVNANTIVRTYEHLGFDGTVRSVKGVGFFVAEGASESIKERRRQAFFDELLPLCVKQMELLGISPDEIIPIIKRHENKQ